MTAQIQLNCNTHRSIRLALVFNLVHAHTLSVAYCSSAQTEFVKTPTEGGEKKAMLKPFHPPSCGHQAQFISCSSFGLRHICVGYFDCEGAQLKSGSQVTRIVTWFGFAFIKSPARVFKSNVCALSRVQRVRRQEKKDWSSNNQLWTYLTKCFSISKCTVIFRNEGFQNPNEPRLLILEIYSPKYWGSTET